jgi:pantoate--beta-alanine ligase
LVEWETTVDGIRRWSRAARQSGRRVGLVPTMGYLHDGHLALVRALRTEAGADAVILSIFVNPLQFGPQEDFDRYPRDLDRDRALAEAAGVDAVFHPAVAELYPFPAETFVDVPTLAARLEGVIRPTHFRGVTTVVTKLFHATEPDVAAFGQKDAQQAVIIRRMTAELLFPTRILVVPTVREPDGLALSSRNSYLTPAERAVAPILFQALQAGRSLLDQGERRASVVRDAVLTVLGASPLVRPDYAEVLSLDDLEPVSRVAGRILLAVAARIGTTRLIDNLCLEVDEHGVRNTLP